MTKNNKSTKIHGNTVKKISSQLDYAQTKHADLQQASSKLLKAISKGKDGLKEIPILIKEKPSLINGELDDGFSAMVAAIMYHNIEAVILIGESPKWDISQELHSPAKLLNLAKELLRPEEDEKPRLSKIFSQHITEEEILDSQQASLLSSNFIFDNSTKEGRKRRSEIKKALNGSSTVPIDLFGNVVSDENQNELKTEADLYKDSIIRDAEAPEEKNDEDLELQHAEAERIAEQNKFQFYENMACN